MRVSDLVGTHPVTSACAPQDDGATTPTTTPTTPAPEETLQDRRGRWRTARRTAQGALLIALEREDVVLPGDLALRKAVRSVYKRDRLPSQQEVLTIGEKWRPFRSLATSCVAATAPATARDSVES
jgi:hypothetical protein